MRTKRIKVYKFNELSESAKQTAIENYRNKGYDNSHYYDEVTESVKKVIELFGLQTGNRYSDVRTGHMYDNILELSGKRLYAYIMNNYYSDLFKPKYIKTLNRQLYCKQFITKQYETYKKEAHTTLYSKLFRNNDCTLTGVCYDNDILQPVYDYLSKPSLSTTFKDVISDIEDAIIKTYDNVEDCINSDEFIIDDIEANFEDSEYTENGQLFNL